MIVILNGVDCPVAGGNDSAIETYRISNLVDLNTLVPNLSAVEGAGGSRSVLFQIRGLYASGTALAADSGVAIYQAAGILAAAPSLEPLIGPSFGTKRPDSVNNAFHMRSNQITQGHNLTAEYAINDSLTFRNILAYREVVLDTPAYTLDGLGQFAPIVLVFATSSSTDSDQVSEEMQLIWDTDNYTLTTGFLYYALDQAVGGYRNAPNAWFGSAPPNLTFLPGTATGERSTAETASYAVYGQWEYRLTPEWEVIVGGRITNDQKDYIDRTLLNGEILDVSYDETEPTFLLGVNYQPTDSALIFAKVSNGYFSGGVVSGLSFEPEKAESFEIGLKADWLERTLQTNISVFSVDYQDQQFVTSGP